MDATARREHETSNGIILKVPRRVLPYIGAFLLGGGGGVASILGMQPGHAEAAPAPSTVQRQIEDLNRAREEQAKAIALIQQQVQDGFAAVRGDLAGLKDDVKDLASERRRR